MQDRVYKVYSPRFQNEKITIDYIYKYYMIKIFFINILKFNKIKLTFYLLCKDLLRNFCFIFYVI